MKIQLPSIAAVSLLLAACGGSSQQAPWLTVPDAVAHAKHFPIAVGDTHGPQAGQAVADCNACHAVKTSATTSVPSDTFKVFTCTNCHSVTLKSGVQHDGTQASFSAWHNANGVTGASGFDATVASANTLGYASGVEPLSAACHHCHQNGIGVDHAARLVLPHQNATGTIVARCADCHVVDGDRKQLGCSSCHPHSDAPTDAAHAGKVPDYVKNGTTPAAIQASSLLCARCHEDAKVPVRVAAHATGASGFLIGAGSHTGAAGGACLTCHDQNKTTAPRTFVADFTATNCVGCHDVVVGAVAGVNAIHGSASSLAPLHTSVADFNALWTGPQLSVQCLICHSDGGASGAAPSNHEQLFPRAAGTKHAGISCSSCHTNAANRKDLTAFGCASCHAGITTPKTLTAAHTITGYAITTYLTATTAGGTKSTVTISMTDSRSCLRCHADGQVDRITSHSTGSSGFGQGEHRTAGCLTCHSKLRTDKPWGANFGEAKGALGPPPTGCYVCHKSGRG
jgi:predicted CXXCH cytochrome family protein